jgi:hypothetical protein
MTLKTPKQQLIDILDNLTPEQHTHLLTVAQQLQRSPLPPGTSGNTLLALLDEVAFAEGEADTIMQAIRDNEEIDWDGWK